MFRLVWITLLCITMSGCGNRGGEENVKSFNRRPVTLPDGTVVQAEAVSNRIDMGRGMMFRDSLPEGEAMLFIHGSSNKYGYWMYQVKIPLDIIWMDARGVVVELSENTPPCNDKSAKDCPTFGGNQESMVVLELPGGYGRKHGVALGQTIRF